jgi:hypothetical protein
MTRERERFWIVWSPQGTSPPSRRHDTIGEATAEAKRLAEVTPRAEFYVLEAKSRVQKVSVSVTELTDDPIPF